MGTSKVTTPEGETITMLFLELQTIVGTISLFANVEFAEELDKHLQETIKKVREGAVLDKLSIVKEMPKQSNVAAFSKALNEIKNNPQ